MGGVGEVAASSTSFAVSRLSFTANSTADSITSDGLDAFFFFFFAFFFFPPSFPSSILLVPGEFDV